MVIEDVEADTLYAPFHTVARVAGYRAVQSTPIISREGTLLGTLATHFRSVHRPTEQDLRLLDLYVRQAADIIEHHRDITKRKELEDHKSTLISELDHRVKNVLAVVLAVASRTQETSGSMADFVAALDGRIKSMATTHELLSYSRWRGIPLADLVRNELAPYATADNTLIDGPDVVLRAELGQTLAMVFHELATNAAKFGAISARTGRVSVRWKFIQNGHVDSWLSVQWEESGGPNVVPPTRSGYGTSVVLELIPYEFGGTVDLTHNPEGVRCKLDVPAHWLITSNRREEVSTDVAVTSPAIKTGLSPIPQRSGEYRRERG
jgi:two-component sensor histidine kinase